ncbi:hypothetical protein L1887_15154 [Cichorium endivia]|nr:hypothetical protein L1887_15154 [Cichorium endivia]
MEFPADDQPEVVAEYEESKIITNSNNKFPSPPPSYIQIGLKNSKGKVHDCSICGSEFLSGQALGGHMRRHRPPPPSSSQITVSSNMDNTSTALHSSKKSPVLSSDLNLPAPKILDDVHSNF